MGEGLHGDTPGSFGTPEPNDGETTSQRSGFRAWTRHFAPPEGPFHGIERGLTRTARITNSDGSTVFEQEGVEAPAFWSDSAVNIAAQKYFVRNETVRETSVFEMIEGVAKTIGDAGAMQGYFATREAADSFTADLTYLLIHQMGAFNSPVWFNVRRWHVHGIPGGSGNWGWDAAAGEARQVARNYERAQISACFIHTVDDSLVEEGGIADFLKTEMRLFKYGSGSGANFSRIRERNARLSPGGNASGLMSFLPVFDRAAGSVASGGASRRAAKMVVVDIDHPEILDFIRWKMKEEKKAQALMAAGFSGGMEGEAYTTVSGQNANNSVRVTDAFMRAVERDEKVALRSRVDGRVVEEVPARMLWQAIAEAAWACADPGLQFHDTTNAWHTTPNAGMIRASNPCAEYVHLDNSACNLASLNLVKFLREGGNFNDVDFDAACRTFIVAQDILVDFGSYPTKAIAEGAHRYRQLGLGYANLGAMLALKGLAYDSEEGRREAARITSRMTANGYLASATLAAVLDPFDGFAADREGTLRVIAKHKLAHRDAFGQHCAVWEAALDSAREYGVRNAQVSLLAPTGCLVASSLVPTDRGLVRIESLGDVDGPQWQDLDTQVQTDEGPQRATKFYVNGVDDVIDVRTARGYRLRGTPKHQIKVVDASGQWVWRRLGALEQGDCVPLALNQMVGAPQHVALPACPPTYRTNQRRGVRTPEHLDAGLAELVGMYAANGSLHLKGLRFSVYSADTDAVERYVGLLRQLFGVEPRARQRGEYTELALHSTQVRDWWVAAGFGKTPTEQGGKGFTARVPDAILASNDPGVYGAYLRGLFTGDGTVNVGLPSLSNKDRDFCADVQTLLLALGIPSGIDEQRGGWSGRGVWRLQVVSRNFNTAFTANVGFSARRKQDKIERANAWSRADYIPLPKGLRDRLCPIGAPLRDDVIRHERDHKGVGRHIAEALYRQTNAPELGHLLAFYYDAVECAELSGREPTYDISVPANVTYYANGFVSHNTIGFLMGCATTGIEPLLGHVQYKQLAGGGTMQIVNELSVRCLRALGYDEAAVQAIAQHIEATGGVSGAPGLRPEHLPVFDTALPSGTDGRAIVPDGHLLMMAAVQPFLSGAISKTCNLPADTTVEEIADCHMKSWKLGLKAIAVYRDGCKSSQPVTTKKAEPSNYGPALMRKLEPGESPGFEVLLPPAGTDPSILQALAASAGRAMAGDPPFKRGQRKLPKERRGTTWALKLDEHKLYVRSGEYPDGTPGEIFIDLAKEGSTLGGLAGMWAKAVSLCLQYGVPLEELVETFTYTRFEPWGRVLNHPTIKTATSIADLVMRVLAVRYLGRTDLQHVQPDALESDLIPPPTHAASPEAATPSAVASSPPPTAAPPAPARAPGDGPPCPQCGTITRRTGTCHACPQCGTSLGCS